VKKVSNIFLVIIVLVIGVAGVTFFGPGLSISTPSESRSGLKTGLTAGMKAPDFEGVTLDGEYISLSDFQGKAVFLNIFASWCGPCRLEAPHLAAAQEQLHGQVVFIGMNLEESPGAVQSFQSDFGIQFPLVLNQNGDLTNIFQPVGLPTSWLIDANGIIRYVHIRPLTRDLVLEAAAMTLQGENFDPFNSSMRNEG
jgi:thiol-disulfide isomerase/thioredoxin